MRGSHSPLPAAIAVLLAIVASVLWPSAGHGQRAPDPFAVEGRLDSDGFGAEVGISPTSWLAFTARSGGVLGDRRHHALRVRGRWELRPGVRVFAGAYGGVLRCSLPALRRQPELRRHELSGGAGAGR